MTEATSGRALSGGTTSSDSMSVETCVNFCNDAGFAYAGLEYGRVSFLVFQPPARLVLTYCPLVLRRSVGVAMPSVLERSLLLRLSAP